MFCAKCGVLLPDTVKYCYKCGWQVIQQGNETTQPPQQTKDCAQAQESTKQANENTQYASEQPAHQKKSSFGFLKKIISAVVAILVLVAIISAFQKHPVNDLKDVIFDNYGTVTFGDAVDKTMRNIEWNTEKISKTHYQVTVSGFMPDTYANASLTFSLNYSDDHVYAHLDHIIWNDEYFDDAFNLSYAMTAIYGG